MIMFSTRYTSLCNICLQNVFSDSLQCSCCLAQVYQRCARLNDTFINSLNADDVYWNYMHCIELCSIFSINDNDSTNVTLKTSHCSYFYYEKVDLDINFQNTLMLIHHALQQNNLQTLHDAKGIYIIYIYCRSLYVNFNKLRILLDHLE